MNFAYRSPYEHQVGLFKRRMKLFDNLECLRIYGASQQCPLLDGSSELICADFGNQYSAMAGTQDLHLSKQRLLWCRDCITRQNAERSKRILHTMNAALQVGIIILIATTDLGNDDRSIFLFTEMRA